MTSSLGRNYNKRRPITRVIMESASVGYLTHDNNGCILHSKQQCQINFSRSLHCCTVGHITQNALSPNATRSLTAQYKHRSIYSFTLETTSRTGYFKVTNHMQYLLHQETSIEWTENYSGKNIKTSWVVVHTMSAAVRIKVYAKRLQTAIHRLCFAKVLSTQTTLIEALEKLK